MQPFLGSELGQLKHDYGNGLIIRFFAPAPKVKDMYLLREDGEVVYKSSFKGFKASPEVMENCMREIEEKGHCVSEMTVWRRSFDFISTRSGEYQVDGVRGMMRNQAVLHYVNGDMYIQRHLPWGAVGDVSHLRDAPNTRLVYTPFRCMPRETRLAAFGHKRWVQQMQRAKEELKEYISTTPAPMQP